MFYIDIYTKDEEGELVFVKSVSTDYEHLTNISFAGLNPDSTYYYKISAYMNGRDEKTPGTEPYSAGRTNEYDLYHKR